MIPASDVPAVRGPSSRGGALRAEMRRTLRIGLPLMGAQLLSIGNGLIDTLVAGQLGPKALGAIAIGAGLIFLVTIACIGLMAALSPTMAALRSQGRRHEVGVVFRQGIWLALVFGLAAFAVVAICRRTMPSWGLAEDLIPGIDAYLAAAGWSVIPSALLLAARNVCEATGRTGKVLLVQGVGLVVNAIADVTLGLGVGLAPFGIEAFGISGIGWSTTLVQVVACTVLFVLLRQPTFDRFALYRPMEALDAVRIRQLLALAAPICLTLLAESGLFMATAVQMGQLGVLEASAHNIAITMTAAFYMLPLGLSFALTARAGGAYGKRWWPGVRLRAMSGLLLALALSLSSALVLVVLREPIAALFSDDVAVRSLAARLLLLAAVFQISDAMQATLVGLLRGLQDTRLPMLINLFSYWAIGFGIGWYAANRWGFGADGLWFGLIAGLTSSALLQGLRLAWLLRERSANGERASPGRVD